MGALDPIRADELPPVWREDRGEWRAMDATGAPRRDQPVIDCAVRTAWSVAGFSAEGHAVHQTTPIVTEFSAHEVARSQGLIAYVLVPVQPPVMVGSR
jgi:hypothetical protein